MAKRIYFETIKKYAIGAGISSTAIIFLLFWYLSSMELITIHSYTGDTICAGTIDEPCIAIINFTVNKEDIFIYPVGYDPYGRDTPFNFTEGLSEWKLQRSWGKGWRNIDLTKGCTGSWCGCYWCTKTKLAKYSYVFRTGRIYTIRIVAYKQNAFQDVKWGFATIDPVWKGTLEYELLEVGNSFTRPYLIFRIRMLKKDYYIDSLAKFKTKFTVLKGQGLTDWGWQLRKYTNWANETKWDTCYTSNVLITFPNGTTLNESYLCNPQLIKHWRYEYHDFNPLGKTIKNYTWYYVKLWGKKEPRIGTSQIDAIPVIGNFELPFAWWNTSFEYCRNITVNETIGVNRTNEPFITHIDASGWPHKPHNDSIRIVNNSCNSAATEIQVQPFNITQTAGIMSDFNLMFLVNVSDDAVANFSMYYNDTSVGLPSYWDDWNYTTTMHKSHWGVNYTLPNGTLNNNKTYFNVYKDASRKYYFYTIGNKYKAPIYLIATADSESAWSELGYPSKTYEFDNMQTVWIRDDPVPDINLYTYRTILNQSNYNISSFGPVGMVWEFTGYSGDMSYGEAVENSTFYIFHKPWIIRKEVNLTVTRNLDYKVYTGYNAIYEVPNYGTAINPVVGGGNIGKLGDIFTLWNGTNATTKCDTAESHCDWDIGAESSVNILNASTGLGFYSWYYPADNLTVFIAHQMTHNGSTSTPDTYVATGQSASKNNAICNLAFTDSGKFSDDELGNMTPGEYVGNWTAMPTTLNKSTDLIDLWNTTVHWLEENITISSEQTQTPVTPAVPNHTNATVYLNGTSANYYYANDSIANFTVTLNISGYVNLTTNISNWIDLTSSAPLYNTTSITCSANNTRYNITGYFQRNATHNYSSDTHYAICYIPEPTNMSLYLNGTDDDKWYNNGTYANFTATINVTGLPINLTTNITNWVDLTSATKIENITMITCTSNNTWYNITAYYEGNTTYSASSRTHYVICNVTLKVAPTIRLALNDTEANKTYVYGQVINATGWVETGDWNYSIKLFRNETSVTYLTTDKSEGNYSVKSTVSQISEDEVMAWIDNDTASTDGSSGGGEVDVDFNISSRAKYIHLSMASDSTQPTQKIITNLTQYNWNTESWETIGNKSQEQAATCIIYNLPLLDGTDYERDKKKRLMLNVSYSSSGATTLSCDGESYGMTTFALIHFTLNTTDEFIKFGGGFYNYTFLYEETENYTKSFITYWANVTKTATQTKLFLNGTEDNKVYALNEIINLTTIVNYTAGNISLDMNATGFGNGFANGSGSVTNITNSSYLGKGDYNVTAHFDGDENVTSSKITYYLYVRNLSMSVGFPINTTQYEINYTSCFELSPVAGCYQNGTFNIINQTISTPIFNITNTGEETGNITIYLNQTITDCHMIWATNTSNYLYNMSLTNSFNLTNTTHQTIWYNLASETTNSTIWMWEEYRNCTAGTVFHEEIELEIEVIV